MNIRKTIYGISPYSPPQKTITESEYRSRVDAIGKNRNLTNADEQFLSDLEDLRNDLYDMIAYNTKSLDVSGTKYYVSTSGDDNNDGLSPETAWSSLEKVANADLQEGDGVYFKRGDLWRGSVPCRSGITYTAYGEGRKPRIYSSYDATNPDLWVKTDVENIWVYDVTLSDMDIGVIVFNNGESYANKKPTRAKLENELDFCYTGPVSDEEEEDIDNKVYLYSSNGNPAKIFEQIELSRKDGNFKIKSTSHDIRLNNLECFYGQDFFFAADLKNIELSYCVFAWQGGHYYPARGKGDRRRYGGGGGCWHGCDTVLVHHCFFTQQFDCSCTPQFGGSLSDHSPAIFKDFKYYDNLVEYCEWSFEYYNGQTDSLENKFDGLYLGYNFMRKCGYGFGDKHGSSRHIRSGSSVNPCYNSLFESNIFDRARYLSIDICSRTERIRRVNDSPYDVNYDTLQKLKNNIYIEPKNKHYADINLISYNFNQAAQITLKKLGVEENSIFIFAPENN